MVCTCQKILEGVRYYDKTLKTTYVNKSGLFSVQKFFEDVIGHEMISYIILEIDDIPYMQQKNYEREIKANQFCQTIIDALNPTHLIPTLRLKIIK